MLVLIKKYYVMLMIVEVYYENTMICKYDNNDGSEEITDQSIIEQIMKLYIESKNNK